MTTNYDETHIKGPSVEIPIDTNFSNSDAWNYSTNNFSQCESFEGEIPPFNWQVMNGGSIELSEKHYKNGQKSLKWNFRRNSTLYVANPKGIESAGRNKSGGIKAWVYNETPLKEKITFNFGSKNEIDSSNPRYTFDFNLNFKGWRALCVDFKFDAQNHNYIGEGTDLLSNMEIVAPVSVDAGELFLDIVEFSDAIQWNRTPDYQIPRYRTTFNEGKGGTWERSLYYSLKKPEIPLEETITKEQIEAFELIEQRYKSWVMGDDIDLSQEPIKIRRESINRYIEFGLEKYNNLNIKVDETGNITGVPLFASRSAYGPKFGSDVATKVFMPLVFDYKLNGNLESKEKLMTLFDYFNDQGWAEGSAIETLDHETNRSSGYCHAVYIMREELKASGRLERELATLKWYTNFGKTFGEDYTESTADDVRTHFMYKLLYVLAMENIAEKVQYMKGLIKWMNSALAIAPGFGCTIKPDFTGFHHRGIYSSAYTPQAYHMASVVIYLLHDTSFALSSASLNNVKNALLTQRVMSNKYDVPIGVSGRFPHKYAITNEIIPAYAYMALSFNPIDKELAETFMNLWEPGSEYLKKGLFPRCGSEIVYYDTLGAVQIMLKAASLRYSPAKDPEGYWVKPYGALSIHRRDHWMVSTKGWSQYSWDFEGGKKHENIYGRYSGYGALQIIANGNPVNTLASGYNVMEGWDWKRWPGTTVINLPLEKINYIPKLNNHRYFSDSTFVGGVSSQNRNGLFAVKLHDSVYNKSFYANKTYFCFDNEIICLGSDIENDDKENRTETTLFQCFIQNKDIPFYLKDKRIDELPYSVSTDGKEAVSLLDPYGNGYICPVGNGIHLERSLQQSKDPSGRSDTEGLYTTAWIDHGCAPIAKGYEYVILVQSTLEELKKYASNPDYKVWEKDKRAHILEHKGAQTIGYAVFDHTLDIQYGPLKKVSEPSLILIKYTEDGILLSLADPDLRLPKMINQHMDEKTVWASSEMKQVQVILEGKWYIEDNLEVRIVASAQECTTIEFDCVDGKTIEIEMKSKIR